jgi:hypothetical protein
MQSACGDESHTASLGASLPQYTTCSVVGAYMDGILRVYCYYIHTACSTAAAAARISRYDLN